MTPIDTILDIIRLSLQIILEAMQGMTPEQKAEAWRQHFERVKFWEDLVKQLQHTPPPVISGP